MELPDYLPISMLNQLEYCSRRFWLMFVCGEMETNAPVAEGTLQHERAHGGGSTTEGEVVSERRVNVGSERLRLLGVVDVVEMQDGHLVPVEYKHGRMGKWLNDHVQLCAQAMCLEENLTLISHTPTPDPRLRAVGPSTTAEKSTPLSTQGATTGEGRIEHGEIFYWGSRRRVRVEFTPELRARTEAAVNRAFELLARGEMPPPLPRELRAKCRDCSLEPVCLPEETVMLSSSGMVE